MKTTNSIPVSNLPKHLQAPDVVEHLELDQDGNVDVDRSLKSLATAKKKNTAMNCGVFGLVVTAVFLMLASLGTSIAAITMVKDTTVDPETGIATVKGGSGGGMVLKTSEALVELPFVHPGVLSIDKLAKMKQIIMSEGQAMYNVLGFWKSADGDQTVVVVEGGTLTYNADGLVDASGDAFALIKEDNPTVLEVGEEDDGQRKLKWWIPKFEPVNIFRDSRSPFAQKCFLTQAEEGSEFVFEEYELIPDELWKDINDVAVNKRSENGPLLARMETTYDDFVKKSKCPLNVSKTDQSLCKAACFLHALQVPVTLLQIDANYDKLAYKNKCLGQVDPSTTTMDVLGRTRVNWMAFHPDFQKFLLESSRAARSARIFFYESMKVDGDNGNPNPKKGTTERQGPTVYQQEHPVLNFWDTPAKPDERDERLTKPVYQRERPVLNFWDTPAKPDEQDERLTKPVYQRKRPVLNLGDTPAKPDERDERLTKPVYQRERLQGDSMGGHGRGELTEMASELKHALSCSASHSRASFIPSWTKRSYKPYKDLSQDECNKIKCILDIADKVLFPSDKLVFMGLL